MPAGEDIKIDPVSLNGFYSKYFAYYNTLEERYQRLFIRRCHRFIHEKNISGAEDFVPDNRVKALVAASAVQLTLGLETWDLAFFESIILHPSDFDNAGASLKFSGETNLAGFVKLSWKKFLKGYQVKDDNLNLGLHEFSHALRFNSIQGHDQDYFIEHYFYSWLASAYEAFDDIRNNRETIFRRYGGANINEFVSVCIEHYFESPQEIKEHYPLLYLSTAILLNQATENNRTRLDIRAEFFEEKNRLLPGFSEWQFSSREKPSKLRLFLYLLAGGIFAFLHPVFGLTTLVLLLSVLLWEDFHFTGIRLNKKELAIQKGSLVFRRGASLFPVSQLISARRLEEEAFASRWELIFYNSNNGFFYSEEVSMHSESSSFIKELHANKAACFK